MQLGTTYGKATMGKDLQEVLGHPKGLPRDAYELLVRMGRETPEIQRIILFGSRARLEAGDTSDVDTCSVIDDPADAYDEGAEAATAYRLERIRWSAPRCEGLSGNGWDNLARTRRRLEEHGRQPVRLEHDVLAEGVTVYERG